MLECRDIDALMMDWLYQELEPSQSSPFDAHVAKCARCQAEIEGMKRTRAALRDLPEVEPPPAITQILLHEAARKAPAAAVGPAGSGRRGILAWMGDLFAPIAAHPAATALATLVVVAGVAGTLYLRGEHEVAQPRADSAAPPPVDTVATGEAALMPGFEDGEGVTARLEEDNDLGAGAPAEEPGDLAQAGQAQATAVPPTADPAPGDYRRARDLGKEGKLTADEAGGKREQEKAQVERQLENRWRAPNAPPSGSRAGGRAPDVSATTGAEQIVDGESDGADDMRFSPPASGKGKDVDAKRDAPARIPPGGSAGGVLRPAPVTVTDTAKAPAKQKPAEPTYKKPMAEPPPVPPADKNSQLQIGGGNYRVYLQNPQDNSYVSSKESQLEQALRRNDCQVAGRIANDILDRSYEYYVANVKYRAEKSCKKFIDAEWRTRYAARVERARKANAGKGGGGSTGTANKAKAAPRQDDAAESAPASD